MSIKYSPSLSAPSWSHALPLPTWQAATLVLIIVAAVHNHVVRQPKRCSAMHQQVAHCLPPGWAGRRWMGSEQRAQKAH